MISLPPPLSLCKKSPAEPDQRSASGPASLLPTVAGFSKAQRPGQEGNRALAPAASYEPLVFRSQLPPSIQKDTRLSTGRSVCLSEHSLEPKSSSTWWRRPEGTLTSFSGHVTPSHLTERGSISLLPAATREAPKQSNAASSFPIFACTKWRKNGDLVLLPAQDPQLSPHLSPNWAPHIYPVSTGKRYCNGYHIVKGNWRDPWKRVFCSGCWLEPDKAWLGRDILAKLQEKFRSLGWRKRGQGER